MKVNVQKPDETASESDENFCDQSSVPRSLHRIRMVRKEQNMSLRVAARQMKQNVRRIREQEDPQCDISLSTLYEWQRALGVSIADLLVDTENSPPVPRLSPIVVSRLMKTAHAILNRAPDAQTHWMVENFIDQLLKMIPEVDSLVLRGEFTKCSDSDRWQNGLECSVNQGMMSQ